MVEFTVLALAVSRLSWLLVWETGPYNLLAFIRHKAGVRYNERSERYATNQVAELFNCVWCMSVWLGFFVAVAYVAFNNTWVLLLPFALSEVAVLLSKVK